MLLWLTWWTTMVQRAVLPSESAIADSGFGANQPVA